MKILIAPVHHYMNNYEGSEYTRVYEFLKTISQDNQISGDAIVGFSDLKSMGNIKIHSVYSQKPAYISSFRRFSFPFLVLLISLKLMAKLNYDCIWHLGPFAFDRTFNLLPLINTKKIRFVVGPIYTPFGKKEDKNAIPLNAKSGRRTTMTLWEKVDSFIYNNFSAVPKFLSDFTLRKANKVIVFEKAGLKILQKKGVKNAEVIHLGVTLDDFRSKPKKHNKKVFRLLVTGYLLERKGVMDIVIALSQLVTKFKKNNVTLTIVGDGPMWNQIRSLIKRLKLSKLITMVGQVPRTKIHTYYKNADIFVSGSILDTMPAMYFEAMSSALPMVIAKNDSANELQDDNFGGIVVPGKNPVKMAEALAKIIDNPKLYAQLSLKNYTLSATTYNFDKSINRLKQILEGHD